jgi:GNAT superfamily N-acetyltransferase
MPTIRPATPDDAQALAQVLIATWHTTYTGIVPQPYLDALDIDEAAERWRPNIVAGKAHFLVAETEPPQPQLIGFVAGGPIREPLAEYDAELYALYLLRDHQGAGLGRALVQHLAAKLCAQGFHKMAVWALAQNPAVAFYKCLGALPLTGKLIEIGGARLPDLALGMARPPPSFINVRNVLRGRRVTS